MWAMAGLRKCDGRESPFVGAGRPDFSPKFHVPAPPGGYVRGNDVFVIGRVCFTPATYKSLGAVRSVNVSS